MGKDEMKKYRFKIICFIFTLVVLFFQTCTPLLAADCADEIKQINNALLADKKEEATRLISSASDINCKSDVITATPLVYATYFQQEDMVKLLIEKHADTNIPTKDNKIYPLYFAVMYNNINITKMLIEAGADVNIRNEEFGPTPLYFAVQYPYGDMSFIAAAENELSDVEGYYYSPLVTQSIKDAKAKFASRDIYGTVDLLIKNGANVNEKSLFYRSPLAAAIDNVPKIEEEKTLAIVKLLIKSGADYSVCNDDFARDAVSLTLQGDLPEVLLVMLQNDKKLQTNECYNKYEALHYAVVKNNIALVKLLIQRKDLINLRDDAGGTPLHYAACTDNDIIAKLLLNAGAKTNIKAKSGMTPLQLAKKLKSKKVVKLLSTYGKKH